MTKEIAVHVGELLGSEGSGRSILIIDRFDDWLRFRFVATSSAFYDSTVSLIDDVWWEHMRTKRWFTPAVEQAVNLVIV